jgi:hypothetical protein
VDVRYVPLRILVKVSLASVAVLSLGVVRTVKADAAAARQVVLPLVKLARGSVIVALAPCIQQKKKKKSKSKV